MLHDTPAGCFSSAQRSWNIWLVHKTPSGNMTQTVTVSFWVCLNLVRRTFNDCTIESQHDLSFWTWVLAQLTLRAWTSWPLGSVRMMPSPLSSNITGFVKTSTGHVFTGRNRNNEEEWWMILAVSIHFSTLRLCVKNVPRSSHSST